MQDIVIHCDGASRGNPGQAACGFVVLENGKVIFKFGKSLGRATNNVAEYSAVVEALNWLVSTGNTQQRTTLILDSQLVVNQLNGIYRIKNKDLLKLAQKVKHLGQNFSVPLVYKNVPRDKNEIADTLVNETLDAETLQ